MSKYLIWFLLLTIRNFVKVSLRRYEHFSDLNNSESSNLFPLESSERDRKLEKRERKKRFCSVGVWERLNECTFGSAHS